MPMITIGPKPKCPFFLANQFWQDLQNGVVACPISAKEYNRLLAYNIVPNLVANGLLSEAGRLITKTFLP